MFDQIIDNILYNFYTLNFAVATGTADIVFDLICLKKKRGHKGIEYQGFN